uniref:Si:dkey-177p2.6 n=1 Tax=Cyprinus carpio TaxID=7962 RepID=A0A8C2C1C8_CYPCA
MGQRDITAFEASMKRKNGIPTVSMCRLDVESAVVKKEVEPGGGDGALSSSRYMLGRGVKRKLSTCEDPAQDLPYPQQRQLVLDLCLDKLQSCQRRAEPSLHRSVLLANTLRQIQQEMRQEGETCLPPAPLGPSLPLTSTPRHFPDLPPVPLDCPPPLTGALSPSFPLMMAEDEEVQLCGTENETLLPSLAEKQRGGRWPQDPFQLHIQQQPTALSLRHQRPGPHHGDPGALLNHGSHHSVLMQPSQCFLWEMNNTMCFLFLKKKTKQTNI